MSNQTFVNIEEKRVYCNECKHLEKRQILADPNLDGNYINTGTRYYCEKMKRLGNCWFPVNMTLEQISFHSCFEGERK